MAGKNNSVKMIIAIVVICAAGFVIWRYGFKENPGSTPEQVTFICTECGKEFQVETETVNELRDKETGMVKCPECDTFTGAPGTRCIHCKKYYLERDSIEKHGERGHCTHCGKSARNAPGQEPATLE
jgi:DNA-directed RNA polymerase subunit RPC12/RpoP